jgi:hypothetical protein
LGKKREMMRRRMEEIRQYTMREYRQFYKYTKNLTKEYQPRNLNVLVVNEDWLSEKKKVSDRRNIFKKNN